MLKSGPPKPPRLTGLGPQNTVSISYIQADDSLAEGKTGTAAAQVLHRAQVHSQLSPSKEEEITVEQNSTDMGLASADTFTESLNAQKNPVSCDEMWADDTPCTIRKRASKPIRLADEKEASGEAVTPLSSNTLSRRKSTGSLNASDLSHSTKEGCVATPRLLKSYSSLNKLGFRTPGVDKSLFGISHGDSVLLTPERQEIDKMIQWIDRAFPPDLTYSGLYMLCLACVCVCVTVCLCVYEACVSLFMCYGMFSFVLCMYHVPTYILAWIIHQYFIHYVLLLVVTHG